MKKIILGFLLGVLSTLLIINRLDWSKILTESVLQFSFTTFLALFAGLIALYQVKANVISSARIKWIEEFKINISEYIASLNEAIFALTIYRKSKEIETEYFDKYFVAINRNHSLENKIRLNLNLKEDIYYTISKDLDEIKYIVDLTEIGTMTKEKEDEMLIKFVHLAENTNKALKMEWEKSKKMFYSRWWNNLNK